MRKFGISLFLVWLAAMSAGAAADYGTVNIVSSSHQDTAWMDTPAFCRQYRIEKNIIPALEMMKRDPNYKFSMECMLHLMEFLEAYPERTSEIIELTRAGRLEWGATYNQPYESWLSGEELVRQLYYGRRWLHQNFPGCDSFVAFSPDVPARALQMQQILAKAGVPYLLGSRYTEGLYNWRSPDGSGVIFYSMGHYSNHSRIIKLPAPLAAPAVYRELKRLAPYYLDRGLPPAYCLLNSNDFARPRNFDPLINLWNGPLSPWRIVERRRQPEMRYSSAAEFFDAIAPGKAHLDRLMGERPDVWMYITGPTHAQTSFIRRLAARELPRAETLAAINRLLEGGSGSRPPDNFDRAWMDLLYIDHGIGGKNGHITDVVFQRTTARALSVALSGHDRMSAISDRVKIALPPGAEKYIVFNPYTFPLTASNYLPLPQSWKSARVFNADGMEIPSQIATDNSSTQVNIADSPHGSRATASSYAGPDYEPIKAIDGEWEAGESHPELGASQAWHSRAGVGPHWLVVDFGRPRAIHQLVIRHFGCIGKFGYPTRFTTANFRLQAAQSSEGPWSDLVPPVAGNTLPLTVHKFAPQSVRFLRLFITRGTRAGGDGAARILELEAFAYEQLPPQQYQLVFTAENIPPHGYRTFYLTPLPSVAAPTDEAFNLADESGMENQFYRISLAPGGVKSIYDKELGRELLNTEKWLAGEVFTMLSVAPKDRLRGTDAGEFGRTPLPVMDGSFDRVANHKPTWKLIENGPVRVVYELTQQLADVEVRLRVMVWGRIKRMDFDLELINFTGRPWREFRMALPLALDKPEIAYEVPMGVVRIGRDEIPGIGGHAYPTVNYSGEVRAIHPRQVQNWINASDARGGVTISTSVPVFDWNDPTGAVSYPVIQPVLLASRKSCNVQGNWYPQAGDHRCRFTLTSHAGDWRNGWRAGIANNSEPLPGGVSSQTTGAATAALPPVLSFFSLSADNVMITAIKKAEDDNDAVVRMVEMEGKDSEVTLRTYFRIESAARTNIIEEDPRLVPASEHEVTIKIGRHAIETLKLKLR